MRSIAIMNPGDGTGKTTTAVNLGHALARRGNRVTLVDLDPRGRLAAYLGIFRLPRKGLDRVLLDGDALFGQTVSTRELMDIVPAGERLGEFDDLAGGAGRAGVLRQRLQSPMPDTDYLILDCPPKAGLLVANAIVAVDEILVPVAADRQASAGLARLMSAVRGLESMRCAPLGKAVVPSRVLFRRRQSRDALQGLCESYPDLLLSTGIPEAGVLAECAGAGRTIFEYRPNSRSAAAFDRLASDFINRQVWREGQEYTSDVA